MSFDSLEYLQSACSVPRLFAALLSWTFSFSYFAWLKDGDVAVIGALKCTMIN
jgi:hypothetical protein